MAQKVEAFNLKGGPTESGGTSTNNLLPSEPVGGEIIPFNLFKALPIQLLLILVIMIPVIVLVYKKRDLALNIISKVFF